jgi:hypothetical protein
VRSSDARLGVRPDYLAAALITALGVYVLLTKNDKADRLLSLSPRGQLTIHPGITNTPSPFPLAFRAWGPLSGGAGCRGMVTFVGQANAGSSCLSQTGFEGIVKGLPGVKYFRTQGPGVTVFSHELLYDAKGNVVGENTPIAFPPDSSDPAYLSCNTSKGLTQGRFSSTIVLFG